MQSTNYYVPNYPNYIWKPPSATSSSDPVEEFFNDRLRIVRATIQQVLNEIETRETLSEQTLRKLDAEICEAGERLLQIAPHGSSTFTIGDPRRRASIEGEIAALEKEHRQEQISKWKDTAALKHELRELLREYMDEKRKEKALQP